jgi:hypothetical protein
MRARQQCYHAVMQTTPSVVALGTRVEVELIGRHGARERLTLTLVPDAQADFAAGYLGAGTPLAKALLGQAAGAEVPYRQADLRSVRILSAADSQSAPPPDAAARREAAERQAVDEAESINAMIFASAVNNKWGDYDPRPLDPPAPRPADPDAAKPE